MDQTRPGNVRAQESNVEWVGEPRIGAYQHKHYRSFCRDETVITVNSFVLVLSEEEFHYIAHVEDLYEDKKGSKKAKLRWFHRYEEVKDLLPELDTNAEEIYISQSIQSISVESIDSVATILTPDHYNRCSALLDDTFKPLSTCGIYVCCKEIVGDAVEPFAVSQLPGYSDQSILSSLDSHEEPIRQRKRCRSANAGDSNSISEEHIVNSDASNSFREEQSANADASSSILATERIENASMPLKMKVKMLIQLIDSELVKSAAFEVFLSEDEHVEVLYPGFQGCWFRCKILWKSRKHMKVKYHDLKRPEIKELLPASSMAPPDKLGMRRAGRMTVRPSPPRDAPNYSFKHGDGVDVWWKNSWCEGVIISPGEVSTGDRHLVYLTDENMLDSFQVNDLRVSRDWIDKQWKEVACKLDILSVISSMLSANACPSKSSSLSA